MLIEKLAKSQMDEFATNEYKHKFVYTPEEMEYSNDISPSGRLINFVLQEAPGLSLSALRAHQIKDPFFGEKIEKW